MRWTWWAVPGTIVFLVSWVAAAVALRTAPNRSLNRRLAVLLFLEGVFAAGAFGLLFFFERPGPVSGLAAAGTAAMVALPFQYLSFLAVSLETPLVAPFRLRIALWILGFASLAAALLVLLAPGTFITDLYSPGWAPWNFQFREWGQRGAQLHGLAYLFGLVAAISAWFLAPAGSVARNRALWFAIAFGLRDAYVGLFQFLYPLVRPLPFWGDFIYNPGQGIAYLAYVCLLTYGVLRTQLFDIDLKIRFAIQHSTVVAMIGGAFLVGSEVLELFLPIEGTILGLAAALVIVVALRPVQRFAERLAGEIMPGVEDTPAYFEARKLEVYRAAVEGAVHDGRITEAERRILDRLREQLAIPPEVAAALERRVTDEFAATV